MFDLGEVALAALLHDVGKLLQRGSGMPRSATHAEFGRLLLQSLRYSDAVCEAALKHHGRARSGQRVSEAEHPSTLVVYEADNLASSLRRDEPGAKGFDPEASLNSIFNFVRQRPAPAQRRSYRLGEYGGASVTSYLPAKERAEPHAYRNLKDELVRAFEELGELGFSTNVRSVMNLLERYGSHVRSTTSRADTGDISLFDHSRVTAAISVCIAGHLNETGGEPARSEIENREAERYLFVRGDISGVQSFLYTITSRGALRMLRARSFFLELLAEHAVAELLKRSGVPRTNVIFVGGGGFQLLLPNTADSRKAVDGARADINAALARDFGHTLSLALAAQPCNAHGLIGDGLRETLRALGEALSAAKAGKFREGLEDLFSARPEPKVETCAVCTRDDAPVGRYDSRSYDPLPPETEEGEGILLCPTCHMLGRASLKLVRSRYLTVGGDLRIGEVGYGLSNDLQNALYALDGVGDEACLRGAAPLPAARYATRDDEEKDQIMDFDGLSKKAEGIKRLAVLRMDVDDLGETFRSGLPREMRTFDRYAALSRAFTTFFKMVLPMICAGGYENSLWLFGEKRERAATVVYSGGDDLFIVGAWSDVLELAVDIRRAFREFVCENPSVTISAGISIHKAGEPLYLMAEAAGTAEETAKKNGRTGRKKDSAVLFYEGPDVRALDKAVPDALFWDEVEEVAGLVKQINAFRKPDGKLPFPRGFTRLLLEVVDVYEQEGHLSLPRLAYALARMEEGGRLRGNRDWQELKRKLLEIKTIEKHLRPAATWLDLAEREKGA